MKYKIEFHGWGVELIVGSCSERMFNHFMNNGIDVTDHMCGNMDDELAEEIHGGLTADTKFDNDRYYHNFGPYLNNNTTMIIKDENGNEVYNSDLSYRVGDKWDTECLQEFLVADVEDRYIMVGQEHSKGFQAEYLFELKDGEEFDQSKLTLLFEDFDEDIQIITGVRYNHVDLECTGELSTVGKSAAWYIQDNETQEQTNW
jgi:hypothetical protein